MNCDNHYNYLPFNEKIFGSFLCEHDMGLVIWPIYMVKVPYNIYTPARLMLQITCRYLDHHYASHFEAVLKYSLINKYSAQRFLRWIFKWLWMISHSIKQLPEGDGFLLCIHVSPYSYIRTRISYYQAVQSSEGLVWNQSTYL